MTAQITTFLTVPDHTQGRAAFVAAANAFGHGLTPLANEINAVALEIDTNATNAGQAATDATDARDQAQAYMLAAQSAATASAATWVAGATYDVNDLVWGDATSSRLYRALTAHSGVLTPPADDAINWVLTFADAAALAAMQTTVTTLQAEVDYTITNVTGLQSALDGKATDSVALTDAAGTATLPATAAASVASRLQVLRNNVKQAFADLGSKQATLVSGTNIKTVGGVSLLGSGDIPVGGGSLPIQSVNSNTTAVKGNAYLMTTSLTLTLPASPAIDDQVGVINASGTTTCVIERNGLLLMGLAENMTVNKLNVGFTLVYTGPSKGWWVR